MAEMKQYDPGQFCWVDVMVRNMQAAKDFYGRVFGWTAQDQDNWDGPPYAEFRLEGKKVAGLGQLTEEMESHGTPPCWSSYISVEDVEATTHKASELGAGIAVSVMKILDAGALSFIKDPTGGMVGLWQPEKEPGAEVVGSPGALCWNELATRDLAKAKDFYGQLLGWEYAKHELSPTEYFIIKNRGKDGGGLMQMTEEWGDIQPYWGVYFAVSDADATVSRIGKAGGKTLVPPFDTPVGRISVVGDSQGAVFSIIQMAQPAGG